MRIAGSAGFTLPETLLALSLGGVILLAAAQLYPLLRSQSQSSAHYFRLEQLFNQVAFSMEKDIRRAGFCAGSRCAGRALFIGQAEGEAAHSCFIASWDLNRNGAWEANDHSEPETFGYRLRRQALEVQRGVGHCQGNRWEKLLDPQEVAVTALRIQALGHQSGGTLYELHIAGHWAKKPAVRRSLRWLMRGRNQ
ncbi:prepilin peptidase-dependent protein [Affinibrenneria salicis]|uniref:Prepilin peptidase-dependent protein n=1 Tax=Affinibrenneria salicis TaxID=2590031 RepID=A0A5J5FWC8_9GAMM|nr:prepilin peptidase-dependent protein [Affinibrenneria salicis]KAA8997618.1 prepilin peptidase-dependent protein [Affinibrenneria salicis]